MHDGNINAQVSGRRFFLVGIGGSGMMPLAMILHGRGAIVAGSDRGLDQRRVTSKFDALRALGIALHPQDGGGIVSADQIVVASAAVEDSVADIVRATALGCPRMTRAALNAALFNAAALPIGVAGTSGKSTVTGMIGWILHALGRDPTVMNGAVMKNFANADAPFASALVGTGEIHVSEVDESDGSIALYAPRIAVLNNVSLDHKPLEELNALFAAFLGKAAHAVVNIDNADAATLAMQMSSARLVTVAIERAADVTAHDIVEAADGVTFTVAHAGDRARVALRVPGRHNVSNALAAIGAVLATGATLTEIAAAIGDFAGLKRRFEVIGSAHGITVIDDFGHNPDKIAATLATLHACPGRVLALFQPHGYGPLKVMRRELVAMFAQHLAKGDTLVMPDPVYQGGTTTRDVTSADIVHDLAIAGIEARHIADRTAAATHLVAQARAGDRIVVMGARDDTLSLLAQDMLARIAARG